MQENYYLLSNLLLNNVWAAALVGAILALIIEHEIVWEIYLHTQNARSKMQDTIKPLLHRLKYIPLGMVLVALSYSVVQLFFRIFYITESTNINPLTLTQLFLLSIGLMGLSGYAVMMSAGTRWILTVAKLLATASLLIIGITFVVSYIM